MSKTATESRPRERATGTPVSCHAPAAGTVTVAGTFNDWDPAATPLTRDATGTWSATLDLPPGQGQRISEVVEFQAVATSGGVKIGPFSPPR